jgi:hypothetical protein
VQVFTTVIISEVTSLLQATWLNEAAAISGWKQSQHQQATYIVQLITSGIRSVEASKQ